LDEFESQLKYLADLVVSKRDKETLKRFDRKYKETKSIVAQLKTENKRLTQDIEKLTKQNYRFKKQKKNIMEAYSFLESAKNEQERIDRRFQLRHEIQNMFEWIKIYTLEEKYKEYNEKEPGIIQHMKSKYMKKLRYKFRNIELHGIGGVLSLTNYIDIEE